MKTRALLSALVLSLLMTAFWSSDSDMPEWRIIQLTSCRSGGYTDPRVTDDGRTVFFISTADLVDDNFDRSPEIYKWKRGNIKQLTRQKNCIIDDLALAPDNKRLAFASNCVFEKENTNLGTEVFIRDEKGEVSVITEGRGYLSRRPAWSPDGRYLVFESSANLEKRKNADNSNEIFLADLGDSPVSIRQISDTVPAGGCEKPAVSGTSIICRCNDDIPGTEKPEGMADIPVTIDGRTAGGNPDRNWEIFKFYFSGKPSQLTYTQACENLPPVLSPKGRKAAFISTCNLKLNEKEFPTINFELYLMTPEIVRPFPGFTLAVNSMSWSGDGNVLALSSSLRMEDINPERNLEIFRIKMPGELSRNKNAFNEESPQKYFEPVTDFSYGTSNLPDLNEDGKVIVFVSSADYEDKNQDGSSEVFMAVEDDKYKELESALFEPELTEDVSEKAGATLKPGAREDEGEE